MASRLRFSIVLLAFVTLSEHTLADLSPSLDPGSDSEMAHMEGISSSRDSRVFPLFKLYTNFPVPANTKCTFEGRDGHCLKRSQCKSVNGGVITSGSCANGIGICCIIDLKYDGNTPGRIRIKHSPSHIVNSDKANLAVYEVPKQTDVCQLRLDFKKFDLEQPVHQFGTPDDGTCTRDAFSVSGAQNLDRFTICGDAKDQHLYLHYGESELIKLTLDIGRPESMYDIQVTMIKCSSTERAPDDCAQYFTHTRGMVKSFNFPNQQLNSHKYAVCVRGDSTSIEWSECLGVQDAFFITGINNSASATQCRTDYLTIPGFVDGPTAPVYCGGKFPKIKVSTKPYTMYVNFDNGEPELEPIGPNGCPGGFSCNNPFMPNNTCLTVEPYHCPAECECVIWASSPLRIGPPELDLNNIGFCLHYTKS